MAKIEPKFKEKIYFYDRDKKWRAGKAVSKAGLELTDENILEEYKKLRGKWEIQKILIPEPPKPPKKKKVVKKKKK